MYRHEVPPLEKQGRNDLVKGKPRNEVNLIIIAVNTRCGNSYIATKDGGNGVGSENLLIDGVGMGVPALDNILCPFFGINNSIIPAYCNIVQTGSSYDLTVGSVNLEANNRFIGADATIPVVQNYNINVKPYSTSSGQVLAEGSTMAYIKTHIQEAREQNMVTVTAVPDDDRAPYSYYQLPTKTEDLIYSEVSLASGDIITFSKSMSYSSLPSGVPLSGVSIVYTPYPR